MWCVLAASMRIRSEPPKEFHNLPPDESNVHDVIGKLRWVVKRSQASADLICVWRPETVEYTDGFAPRFTCQVESAYAPVCVPQVAECLSHIVVIPEFAIDCQRITKLGHRVIDLPTVELDEAENA